MSAAAVWDEPMFASADSNAISCVHTVCMPCETSPLLSIVTTSSQVLAQVDRCWDLGSLAHSIWSSDASDRTMGSTALPAVAVERTSRRLGSARITQDMLLKDDGSVFFTDRSSEVHVEDFEKELPPSPERCDYYASSGISELLSSSSRNNGSSNSSSSITGNSMDSRISGKIMHRIMHKFSQWFSN